MKALKRIGRSRPVRRLGAGLAGLYLALVHRTTRWSQEIPPETQALLDGDRPYIVAFWHGRMVLMRAAWPGRPQDLHMLISEHADGQLIAKGMQSLGFSTITGSTRRRGVRALREMTRRLRGGAVVGITPDGPKGPRMRVKIGAIAAAQANGVPILPVSGAATNGFTLNTWDRFCLVLPFGRGLLLWGRPLDAPAEAAGAARERLRLALETELNRLTGEADMRMSRRPVEPAPLPSGSGGSLGDADAGDTDAGGSGAGGDDAGRGLYRSPALPRETRAARAATPVPADAGDEAASGADRDAASA
jgi:hypothetical protein